MVFQIHWANPLPELAPETLEETHEYGIDPEFIISRNLKGEPLSRFKDDIWDCRAYGAISTFVFDSWWDVKALGPMDALARTITNEIKLIHWLSQFEPSSNAGRSRGYAHLRHILISLRALAKMAHLLGISLVQAASCNAFQVALRSSITNLDRGFKLDAPLQGLLTDLAYWRGMKSVGFDVPVIVPETDLSTVHAMLNRVKKVRLQARERTPLIPTRLFAKLIGGALEQIKAAEPYLPHIESYIKAVYGNPMLGVDNQNDYHHGVKRVLMLYPERTYPAWSAVKNNCVSKESLLDSLGLKKYFELHEIKNLKALEGHLSHLRVLCVLLVHSFSGMRASEVRVMPYEPVVNQAVKGFGDVPVLVSYLQKFVQANYSQALVWATSDEGVYAVRIAQKIARLNWYRNQPEEVDMPENLPLWMPSRMRRENHNAHYSVPIAQIHSTELWQSAAESLDLVIEQVDIDELITFDAFRQWDKHAEFAVGKVWPLSSHHPRRSVAVYASRSGMVSLPTLKTQYKHLSSVMTALYSENSSYADSFLIDENGEPIGCSSILESFRESSRFNSSLRFHEQVIESEYKLCGPKGTEIQRAKEKGRLPKIFNSREDTSKAIKQGRFSYKDTPVGGCTLRGVCPHFGLDIILPCTKNCRESVIIPDKLEIYIDSLRFDQEALSPNSRPYKEIEAEIQHVTVTYLRRD